MTNDLSNTPSAQSFDKNSMPRKFWCCFDFYSEDFQLESIFTNEEDAKKWQENNPHATGGMQSHRWIINYSLAEIKEYFKQSMLADLAKLESITINVVNKSIDSTEETLKVLRGKSGFPVAAVSNDESKNRDLES